MAENNAPKGVNHPNIFAAFAAFQAKNPEIKKTAEFGKKDDKMHFMYAPLDGFVHTVSPLLAEQGLSFTWEEVEFGKIVCVLYHTTSKRVQEGVIQKRTVQPDGSEEYLETPNFVWENVMRSPSIVVPRTGDMKAIGSGSTYARRYTLAELLGLAAEEDKDIDVQEQAKNNAANFGFAQAKAGVEKATGKDLDDKIAFFTKEVATAQAVKEGKSKRAPTLGFSLEQNEELLKMAKMRKTLEDAGDLEIQQNEDTATETETKPE
jgi:hypothetical protein